MDLLILIAIPAFFFLSTVVTARIEKRMVWPYGIPEPQPQFPDASGYAAQWVGEATSMGFSFLGWSSDLKGPRYRVSYAMLCSPERDCFVIVGAGTILGMSLRATWIYSRTSEGRVFCTTDNQNGVEIDIARRWRGQLAPVLTFTELLKRHRSLLRDRHVLVQPFAAGREAEEFKRLREERYQAMSRQGLIAFTDGSTTHWRYTFLGSLKVSTLNYSIGLLRGVTGGRIPRCA